MMAVQTGHFLYSKRFRQSDKTVVVLSLRRNFGQTAAFAAGFDFARGDVIVTMDGDLQNDPADIPKLLELIKDNDLVSGWRKKEERSRFLQEDSLLLWQTG